MNFQTVEQANGNKVSMLGTLTEVGGVTFTTNQKEKCLCKIRDDVGVLHNVHIHKGNGQLPMPAQLNQRLAFTLSTFQGSHDNKPYTGYSGFWNDKASVAQPSQPAPQQALPQPHQSKKSEPDWDAIALGKVRHGVVCAAIQSGQIKVANEMQCDEWVQYIILGRNKAPQEKPEPWDNEEVC